MSRGRRPRPSRRDRSDYVEAELRQDRTRTASRPAPGPLSLEELCDVADVIVAGLAEEIEAPDEDLESFLVLDTPTGLKVGALPPFSEEERSTFLFRFLPDLVAHHQAHAVAAAFPAWTAPTDGTAADEHPEREEVVVVFVVAADGRQAILEASVERRQDAPPRIGALKRDLESPTAGPFPAALRAALSPAPAPEWADLCANDRPL